MDKLYKQKWTSHTNFRAKMDKSYNLDPPKWTSHTTRLSVIYDPKLFINYVYKGAGLF